MIQILTERETFILPLHAQILFTVIFLWCSAPSCGNLGLLQLTEDMLNLSGVHKPYELFIYS